MMNQKYKMAENPQPIISWEEYEKCLMETYNDLLKNHSDKERVFQNFFEKHPSFIPGSYKLLGTSGHFPYRDCLISEPEVGTIFKRKPDFVWLAQDSLTFCPVLIEIERPNKKSFKTNGEISADFNQAIGQIDQWRAALRKPENLLFFYEFFEVPDYIRKKQFFPQFGLIYGRREEYEGNVLLTQARVSKQRDDVSIMSFDRLHPHRDCSNLMCVRIKPSKNTFRYHIISIPATFTYSPMRAEVLSRVSGFINKIDEMEYTSPNRKQFLKDRYEYWADFGKTEDKGIITSGDKE